MGRPGEALRRSYGVDPRNVHVVSNAAFLGSPSADHSDPVGTGIRIGFLSNISVEKGFMEFFDIASRLRERGVAVEARIAGPVVPEARPIFDELIGSSPHVQYLGPLYGDSKQAFYRSLDIFVFPTRYPNEAEPLVLHEAMQSGVHSIATSRGAIVEILGGGYGSRI